MKIINKNKIAPCLLCDSNAKEVANFYISIFKNSKITNISYYGESASKGTGMPKGSVLMVTFELDGQEFMALNGGSNFKFTQAISFMVSCKNQQEVDYFWEKLSKGGETQVCSWLKDKFGMSWQIVPSMMIEILKDKDAQKVD